MKEIYQVQAGHLIAKLMQASDDLINLCMRELDSTDCKALCFALQYSDGVKLNLLNSIIPNIETENIVRLLHRVSDLRSSYTVFIVHNCVHAVYSLCFTNATVHSTRIDRKLLLNFLRVSKGIEKQGYSMSAFLIALNYKLDFSYHSSMSDGRFGQENADPLSLSIMDCSANIQIGR